MHIPVSNIEKIEFKKRLFYKCIELIEQRISSNTLSIKNAQAAANSEEKSSAGDKYETSRAMSHLEKDMYLRQLSANQQELVALNRIDYQTLYISAALGSVISCSDCAFFIAAGLGKMNFEGLCVYLLSPHSPVAKLLLKKMPGDSIVFNKIEMIIKAVF